MNRRRPTEETNAMNTGLKTGIFLGIFLGFPIAFIVFVILSWQASFAQTPNIIGLVFLVISSVFIGEIIGILIGGTLGIIFGIFLKMLE